MQYQGAGSASVLIAQSTMVLLQRSASVRGPREGQIALPGEVPPPGGLDCQEVVYKYPDSGLPWWRSG